MPDNNKVLDLIQCTATALDTAERELSEKRAADAKVSQLIPAALDALIANERIDPADREKAAEALMNPVRALEILIKTADVNNTIRPRTMGVPVAEKKASAGATNSLTDPWVGRRTSAKRESDLAYERGLGLTQ